MIEMIILSLKLFILSWVITKFEPLEWIIDLLPDKLIYNTLAYGLTCLKCLLFWTTLIYTQDIFHACLMAFIGFWYMKWITPIENRIRL
jgi:hypothetical protein